MWPTATRRSCLNLPAEQAFFALIDVRDCGNVRSWVDQAANPHHSGPAMCFSSAPDGLVLPLLFGLDLDSGHAHDGGARKRLIAARLARTIAPVTAPPASWKVMAEAWRTTRVPILITLY